MDKTCASDDIKVANLKVNKHVRAYRRAKRALEHLGTDDATLARFQKLQTKHLKISADITETGLVREVTPCLGFGGWMARMRTNMILGCKSVSSFLQVNS
jgi:hypothetical protein